MKLTARLFLAGVLLASCQTPDADWSSALNIDSLMIGEDLNTYYDNDRGLPYSGPAVFLDEAGLVYLKGWIKKGKRDGVWSYYNREEGAEHSLTPFFDRTDDQCTRGFKTPWYRGFRDAIHLVIAEFQLRADTIYEESYFYAPFTSKEEIKEEWKGVINEKGEWAELGSIPSICANAEIINRHNQTRTTGCFCERNGANYRSGLFKKSSLDDGKIVETKTYRRGYLSGPFSYYNYSDNAYRFGGTRFDYTFTSPWLDDRPTNFDIEFRTLKSTRNGPGKAYYIEGGQLKEEHTWVNNKREGPYTEYYTTGEVAATGNYFEDDWTGPIIQTSTDGHLLCVTNWSKGVRDGMRYNFWLALDGTQGDLQYEELWEQGKKQYSISYYNQPWTSWKEPRIELSVEIDGSDTPVKRTFSTSLRFATPFADFFVDEGAIEDAVKDDEEAWGNWLRNKIINPEFSEKSGGKKSYAPCYRYDLEVFRRRSQGVTDEKRVDLCGLVLDGKRTGTWFYSSGEEREILRPGKAPFIGNDGDTTGIVLTWSKGKTFENEKVKHGPSLLLDSETNTIAYFTYENNLRQGNFQSLRVDDRIVITEEGFYEDDVKNGPFVQNLAHIDRPFETVSLTGKYEEEEKKYDEDRLEAIKKELNEAKKKDFNETEKVELTTIMLDRYEIEIDSYGLANWLNMGWEIEIANVGASPFFIDTIICHEAIQIYDFPEEIEAGMRGKLEFEISSEYMKKSTLAGGKSGIVEGKILLKGNTNPETTVITVQISKD